MVLDSLAKLMDAQAVASSDQVSASSYDLGNVTPKRQVGTGEPLSLLFIVTTAAAGDAGTLTDAFVISAIGSAAAALTTPTTHISRTILAADLTAGSIHEVPVPVGTPILRYLGAHVDAGSGDSVSFDCYVVPRSMVQAFLAYAKGYAI